MISSWNSVGADPTGLSSLVSPKETGWVGDTGPTSLPRRASTSWAVRRLSTGRELAPTARLEATHFGANGLADSGAASEATEATWPSTCGEGAWLGGRGGAAVGADRRSLT